MTGHQIKKILIRDYPFQRPGVSYFCSTGVTERQAGPTSLRSLEQPGGSWTCPGRCWNRRWHVARLAKGIGARPLRPGRIG